jgi:[acyl-carrier-protein] S-malonyltransferase
MGYSLIEQFPEFEIILNETLREADACIGFSLSSIIREGPAEKLKETEITQPALLAVSTAVSRWLKASGKMGQAALGHSLGEYSALVHAESLRFQDAIRLVYLRGQLMQSAVPSGQGGMLALIGADEAKAQKLCDAITSETGKILEISVLNNPGQVVVSGQAEAMEAALPRLKEFGIRMGAKLEVSGPFHCSLLREAGRKLRVALNETEVMLPQIPVYSNVTGQVHTSVESIRELLERQVFECVRFENCVRSAFADGATHFTEVGHGQVLQGIVKKVHSDAIFSPLSR